MGAGNKPKDRSVAARKTSMTLNEIWTSSKRALVYSFSRGEILRTIGLGARMAIFCCVGWYVALSGIMVVIGALLFAYAVAPSDQNVSEIIRHLQAASTMPPGEFRSLLVFAHQKIVHEVWVDILFCVGATPVFGVVAQAARRS
jgi:type IV secretory pathway TrbD component